MAQKQLYVRCKLKIPPAPHRVNVRFKRFLASDTEYQFLQQSKIPTYHFQPSLPRLPVPKLEDTCARYLAAQQPLLLQNEFEMTKKYVSDFAANEGKQLHEELKETDHRNKHTSYISEPWSDMYLKDRVPLPINYNPLIVYVNEENSEYNTQVIRASNLLISSLRFMRSLKTETLDPEVFHLNPKKSDTDLFRRVCRLLPSSVSWYGAYMFKAYPLDMVQYSSLFNSTRIPGTGKDSLFKNEAAKHILVMKGGNFYTFDVLDRDGNILNPSDIFTCVKYIAEHQAPASSYPVGILTTENRDVWAKARKHLEAIGNADVLKLIDSSIFNLVLDDVSVADDKKYMMQCLLHGDGRNRWFDKSFSLLFSKDGVAAINFEHSWGDGVAVLRYLTDVFKDSSTKPRIHPDTTVSNCEPEKMVKMLDFKLDDKAKHDIQSAAETYEKFYKSLNFNILEFPGFGKKICKAHRVSPDSIMQLGFQVAFHRQNSHFAATYESCSTAAFKHGRTETVRPCTMATKAFCEAINNQQRPSNSELRSLIEKCSEVHGKLTREAAMGQGFDRHLFALRRLAENKGHVPSVFADEAYQKINKNILSTSTLSSDIVMAGAFGPVVKNGYGIGYSISDDRLGSVVTTYAQERDGSDFVSCLKTAFEDIYSVLVKSKQ
ncbi:carnitine O-palmitoyltransferase 2, mitochondrial [Schistocerca piceifrons]|uniref:carnitine O-palmitoyltransferase 2, mitochondrial n=1 Tax=Schistocerca piceifrons TaxID=274613 RepID=UPI001F5FF471|nr:carnitine O-palmitoyltransferase 2, mitochondrial [Schistocerca piceifrons]XP_047103086.1 carnitine O-palmitoyltransferase 2, mitochondrial [Schistocerca piceifrons]XP_047103087.1 carnitine O-palmitoyltransferase 2, mitochondrial [Schistocerca piceifrons]XP_047103088.1 carnitine O-palmitoyltransferase 2, mitochondrial [Schistocerca piceifrons]